VAGRRRSPEDSRRHLLAAGVELVREEPIGPPLANLRVTDVAARVGLTIGAIYHYWDSQDTYRAAVLAQLFAPDQFPVIHDVAKEVQRLGEQEVALLDAIRAAADLSWDAQMANPTRLRTQLALWATGDAEVHALLRAQYRRLGEQWTALLEEGMPRFGLEPRPPHTTELIAAAMTALLEGFFVRATVDETFARPVPAGEGPPWTPFALAVAALIEGSTRRIPPG
jgi:AcrR family transcriptional regulator